jgi:hypothetical protein
MQHLSPEPVEHREADVGAVPGRVDVNPKPTLPKWGVDHVDEGVGNGGNIGVRRHNRVEGFLNAGSETRVGSGFILAGRRLVAGEPALRSGWYCCVLTTLMS